MAKVTIQQEAPSEAVLKAANAVQTVKDARGRMIGIKKIGVVDRMHLFEVIGGELVKNEAYFSWAAAAFMVSSIDDDPVVRPTSKRELEALIQLLDDDGLNAVAKWAEENLGAGNADEAKAAIKNG